MKVSNGLAVVGKTAAGSTIDSIDIALVSAVSTVGFADGKCGCGVSSSIEFSSSSSRGGLGP